MTMTGRVLVIDDDPMQLELVERGLSRDGYEVRVVTTLAEMAREAKEFAPNVILIDVNMPDTSGEHTIAVARQVAPTARLILYSAWENSKLRVLALQLGADGFISKSESVVAIGRRLQDLQRG
ncbi:MAG TPA: response regulator [Kofleriaceae bacterium]|jgi:DNA-binding response OmpR family regulator|nr:response regulator [Kofleriaceae bacterium]